MTGSNEEMCRCVDITPKLVKINKICDILISPISLIYAEGLEKKTLII